MNPRPRRPDVATVTKNVNALLLRAFVLLQTPLSSATLCLALEAADQALAVASRARRFDLEPRAHLYRGHVLRAWGRWRAAHSAYVRAASMRGIGFSAHVIPGLTRECVEMIRIEEERKKMRDAEGTKNRARLGEAYVRFVDEVNCDDGDDDDDDSIRPGESASGMYLLLNGSGEVVGSRESLPDLRSVRGRGSVHRSPTPPQDQAVR
ncbi:hypothetical protein CPLU01_02087 [Colletotrichum plurivorum]|uniref:Uncharacterized protein n=1 Tax=Colletotrichum plurivorum TaxID=2175906 RepID=A0A8H6NN90_9PEZI|nr:hypothetical protein CPLU01_02087 [Colletotrichum plurivorum]